MNQNLVINFAPISLEGDANVLVGVHGFNADLLKELRAAHYTTNVFFCDRKENVIFDIPVTKDAKPVANRARTIDLAKMPWLWSALLNEALLAAFAGKRDVDRDRPIQVLGRADQSLISHPALPSWIMMRTLNEFTPRTLYNALEQSTFGLICDVRVRTQILANCKDLADLGVSPVGKYVLREQPGFDGRVRPRATLLGKAQRIEGDYIILEDHREGYDRVKSDEVRLEGRAEVFDWCVHQLLRGEAPEAIAVAKKKAEALHGGPGRLDAIKNNFAYLRKQPLEAVPGIKFVVGEMLGSQHRSFPKTEVIKKPALVFDPSGTRTDHWNERGIKAHGPYDQRTFSPKKLNIAVICQARLEGQVDAFMAKFLGGMPDVITVSGQNRQARYGDGFQRRFQLDKAYVQTFTAQNPTVQGYEAACNAALQRAADDSIKWDIAFVQVEERFKEFDGPANPYFATKALLLKNHVPVQSVRLETMAQPDASLVFSMNQLSLASYAKLGGVPWLLAAEQKVAHELVIGLGSHMANARRFGGGERIVGITTIFSSDGSYLLSERTNAVPYDQYSAALTDTLKKTIIKIREEDNWRNTDRVRLIFHMFKPAKDVEAEAIKKAVDGLDLQDVSYAFLHIAPDHPFVVFDRDQKGLPAWKPEKGVLGPSRGLHMKLGDKQSLVVFAGASELKQASDGLPVPCLLSLHRDSTFTDMTYLARQAFDFTAHSWRIMFPERYPITIKYSDLIAERLTGLRQIGGWDDDAIRYRDIGRRLWFL
ncbi:MAG TPA: hypothetical protein VHU23_16335 [Rhizomicrobium sp.]|jgi:hypothetical protein|nr:hypothetical protein [Rhizomicrobium sp.]